MGLMHSKNTIGLLQAGRGKDIPFLMSFYKYTGTKGVQYINVKGNDIAKAYRSQGEVAIDFRAYFSNSDAAYISSQVFIEGIPITFSAIELEITGDNSQFVDSNFLKPTNDKKGVLFRAFGFLDNFEIIAEAGQYVSVRGILGASEFYPGKLLI